MEQTFNITIRADKNVSVAHIASALLDDLDCSAVYVNEVFNKETTSDTQSDL